MAAIKIRLIFCFIVLFSMNGFSQTGDQSEHPLLDKYYPQPKKDTPKTVVKEKFQPPTPKPEVFPAPIEKQLPAVSPPVEKPIVANEISTPTVTTAPTPTSITSPQNGNTTPINNVTLLEKPPPPVINSDTLAVVKTPPAATVKTPVKEAVQPRSPAPPPYMDTRLGSSTKQYDTYEKNSNGAGSVTTSPK